MKLTGTTTRDGKWHANFVGIGSLRIAEAFNTINPDIQVSSSDNQYGRLFTRIERGRWMGEVVTNMSATEVYMVKFCPGANAETAATIFRALADVLDPA